MSGYKWRRQDDGTYTLFEVPVFQETVDRRGKKDAKFSLFKLKELVKQNQAAQFRDSHYPSVHWGHNLGADERPKVGEAANFRLGKLSGKHTIFVDIQDIEEKDFRLIQKGKYPHISVELTRSEPIRIGSIAFLSSNAPYFVLPNIRAGEEVKKFRVKSVTCYSAGDTVEYINRFKLKGESTMSYMEEEKEMMPGEEKKSEFEDAPADPLEEIKSMLQAMEARISALEGGAEDEEMPSTAEAVSQPEDETKTQMRAGEFTAFMDMKRDMGKMRKELGHLKAKAEASDMEKQAEQALRFFSEEGIQIDEESFKAKFRDKVKRYGIAAGTEYISEIEELSPRAPVGQQFSASPYYQPVRKKATKGDILFLEKYREEGDGEYQAAKQAESLYSENAQYFEAQGLSLRDFVDGEVSQVRLKKAGMI